MSVYPFRLGRALGGLPLGTIIGPKGDTVPVTPPESGAKKALIGGLPAGASIFSETTNVFKIRADTYTGPPHIDSAAIVADLKSQMPSTLNGGNANLNTATYNAHFWLIAPGTPRIKVEFVSWNGTDIKRPLWGSFADSVPWPDNATPSAGNDRAIILYDPSTHELWEFWKVRPKPGRAGSTNYYNAPYKTEIGGEMQASFGGYIADTRLNRGVFDSVSGLSYGVAATSISYAGSAISIADVKSGVIDHAIAIQAVHAASTTSFYWPALRSDGDSQGVLREGQRFRFPPELNIDALTGLNVFSRMVMKAIQKYGCIVTDKAGTVSLVGESGGVRILSDGTTGPAPWTEIFANEGAGRAGYDVLRNIPWTQLQALPPDFGKPGTYTDPANAGVQISPVSGVTGSFNPTTRRVTVNWVQPLTYTVNVTRLDNLGNKGTTVQNSSLGTYEFTAAVSATATSVTLTVTGPDGSSGSVVVQTPT